MPRKKQDTAQRDLSTAGPMWRAKTKHGYQLDVVVSALQKAIRRGRVVEALFWGHELWSTSDAVTTGFPQWFWRRMSTISHEDCAADPMVAVLVNAARENARYATENFRRGVGGLMAAHAIMVCCRAIKSREPCDLVMSVRAAKDKGWRIQPHQSSFDKHTATGRRAGRGKRHFRDEGRLLAGPLPPNEYEELFWGQKQPYVPLPTEKGGEPDAEIPRARSGKLFDGNGNGLFEDLDW
jgi:replication-associated recombination protein RarA